MNPVFSIIIPVYNVAPYLRECLDSVLMQTFTDWEMICVDDGSTDGSAAILDKYASRDVRVRVVHQDNRGVSAARNRGLSLANGEWIWFVDGDDVIAKNAIGDVADVILAHPDAMSVALDYTTDHTEIDDAKTFSRRDLIRYEGCGDESLRLFFCGVCGVILKRSAVAGLKFLPYKRNEDGLFMLEAYWRGDVHLKFDRKVYYYRERLGSATRIVPKMTDVASTFETQRRMIEIMREQELRHPGIVFPKSWAHLHDFCFYTYSGMYFRLPLKERAELLSEWLQLQDEFRGRYPIGLERRLRILFVRIFRSARLISFFVKWNPKLRTKIGRLLRGRRR